MIEALKDAFVQGCLTRDELGARAGQALSARICAELIAVTVGIPACPSVPGSARLQPGHTACRWPGRSPVG